MMIEICSFHENMGEVQLITMVPHDIIDVKNAMTAEALVHMPNLVSKTLEELENSGVTLKKRAETVSFESIIHTCANPKISDFHDMKALA
jgi:hydrogenase maturation protease